MKGWCIETNTKGLSITMIYPNLILTKQQWEDKKTNELIPLEGIKYYKNSPGFFNKKNNLIYEQVDTGTEYDCFYPNKSLYEEANKDWSETVEDVFYNDWRNGNWSRKLPLNFNTIIWANKRSFTILPRHGLSQALTYIQGEMEIDFHDYNYLKFTRNQYKNSWAERCWEYGEGDYRSWYTEDSLLHKGFAELAKECFWGRASYYDPTITPLIEDPTLAKNWTFNTGAFCSLEVLYQCFGDWDNFLNAVGWQGSHMWKKRL